MEKRQLVVLFGDSLLMDAVEANLLHREEMGLVRVRTAGDDIVSRLNVLDPDLVIFDFDTLHSQFVLPLLRNRPGLSLIGLDITCNKAITLASQQYLALTADDLARVIGLQALRERAEQVLVA